MGRSHVTMQFKPGGPAVSGTWDDPDTALRKYRSWVGTHGSTDGVVVTLSQETPDGLEELRSWTKEGGEMVHRGAV